MKIIILTMAAGLILGCESIGWEAGESAVLKDFEPLTGVHCESSAMLNMLHYENYGVTEAQIMGAGAILGFVYEKSGFPFLGGRTLEMREHFFDSLGVKWHLGTEGEYGNGWDKIHSILKEGHPVVLRVDMRYLPYLYGGKYGSKHMSFGWHMICITGINAENKTALVTDTEKKGLQTIRLSDLHKARFSDTEMMPPHGEFYWVEKAPAGFEPDWETSALNSLKIIETDMRRYKSDAENLTALDGLSIFSQTLAELDTQVPSYLLSSVLFFNYGSIETNGTGGAAFRRMYHQFLKTTAEQSGNETIRKAADLLKPAVQAWTRLAVEMKNLSEQKSILKNRDQRQEALSKLAQQAYTVYETEKQFYDYIGENIKFE